MDALTLIHEQVLLFLQLLRDFFLPLIRVLHGLGDFDFLAFFFFDFDFFDFFDFFLEGVQ